MRAPINADEPWRSPNAAALDRRTTAALDPAAERFAELCRMASPPSSPPTMPSRLSRQSYLGNLTQVKGGGLESIGRKAKSIAAAVGTSASRAGSRAQSAPTICGLILSVREVRQAGETSPCAARMASCSKPMMSCSPRRRARGTISGSRPDCRAAQNRKWAPR